MGQEATSIVIIGGTGDLAQRKLLPALFHLRCKGRLSSDVRIVGLARTKHDDESYRAHLWNGVREFGGLAVQQDVWREFAEQVYYVSGDLTGEGFRNLGRRLEALDNGAERSNRLYYLSVAPSLYESAVANLRDAGLHRQDGGWRRLVIEKPFGRDEGSARRLNEALHSAFDESQVFRIDHYLGKETVQNLLALRFANTVFEPVWNRNYVDNVQISVTETVDVENRGAYYDESGVVRDMVQNHLLQLLCLVAMEPPAISNAEALRARKADVLETVRRWGPHEAAANAVAGQYEGYTQTKGVAPESRTPTYTAMRLFIDNWRWEGVPFYLRSGKALAARHSEIVVEFKRPPLALFPSAEVGEPAPNALGLCIQPDEGVHLRFQVKVPDQGMRTEPVNMEFHYSGVFGQQELPEAYERLLEDALAGDPGLFIRADQTERAWRIVDPLIECWEDPACGPLPTYRRGSWGPPEADDFIRRDGRNWQSLCLHD